MGRVKVLGFGYRDWALEIFRVLEMYGTDIQIEKDPDNVNDKFIKEAKPELILFYGWSWRVPESIVDNYVCLCLHPAPLPKYRGGSPIQNQILNGEEWSAVSIFRLDNGIDTGPLCSQVKFPLSGSMDEILSRIRRVGATETVRIIEAYMNGGIKYWEQESENVAFWYRRKPEQSKLTIEELQVCSAKYLYNRIRSLQDPYPNAYIECADGRKLYITEAHVG